MATNNLDELQNIFHIGLVKKDNASENLQLSLSLS